MSDIIQLAYLTFPTQKVLLSVLKQRLKLFTKSPVYILKLCDNLIGENFVGEKKSVDLELL